MLTNNFRKFYTMYPGGTLINTNGDTITKEAFFEWISSNGSQFSTSNNYKGCNSLACNYNETTDLNDATRNIETGQNWYFTSNYSNENRQAALILLVGLGDTPPAVTDYKLESQIALGTLIASCNHTTEDMTIVNRVFQNNTENNVTIKELGLYIVSANKYPILLGRKVLKYPVLLQVGGVYSFSYKINTAQIVYSEGAE